MRKAALWAATLALTTGLGGCTVTTYESRPPPPQPAPTPAPTPAPPPTTTTPPPPPPAPTPTPTTPRPPTDTDNDPVLAGWSKLGERWVDGAGGVDRDTFVLSTANQNATFDALRLKIEANPLEIFDMVVTFKDGSTYAPPLKQQYPKGGVSKVLDLPGGRRNIRKVDFRYRNVVANGRAQLELWAR